MMDVETLTNRIVSTVSAHGADVDKFREDVLELAHETARNLASTLDADMTSQLKAALRFLYGIADGAKAAPKSEEVVAATEAGDGNLLEL